MHTARCTVKASGGTRRSRVVCKALTLSLHSTAVAPAIGCPVNQQRMCRQRVNRALEEQSLRASQERRAKRLLLSSEHTLREMASRNASSAARSAPPQPLQPQPLQPLHCFTFPVTAISPSAQPGLPPTPSQGGGFLMQSAAVACSHGAEPSPAWL